MVNCSIMIKNIVVHDLAAHLAEIK